MELWQLDFIKGVFLTDGTELKVVTASRLLSLLRHRQSRAPGHGRQISLAFAQALSTYGCPQSSQTTAPSSRALAQAPVPLKCSSSGSVGRTTSSSASPSGQPHHHVKIEHLHQTIREFLENASPFGIVEAAQEGFDAWRPSTTRSARISPWR